MTHRPAARAHTKGPKAPAYSQAALTAMQNNANAKTAFDFFKSKGLTDEQAAGIVGNLDHEAPGLDPEQLQIGGGPGHGIAQWGANKASMDRWSRKPGDNVVDFAANQNEGGAAASSGTFAFGSSPTSLQTQLDFTWWELNNGYGINALKKQTTVDGATKSFEKTFEAAGKPEMPDRYARANAALAAFGGPRKITDGEDSLLVGQHLQPAAHVDSPDTEGGQVKEGHPTVFVGNQRLPFARVGDPMKIKNGTIVEGDTTVLLGGQAGSSAPGPGGSSK